MESVLRSEDMPIGERFLLLVGRAMVKGRNRAFLGKRILKDSLLIDWERLDAYDLREYFDEEGSRSRRFYYRGHPCMIGNSMLGCVIGLGRLMALDRRGDDDDEKTIEACRKRKRSQVHEGDETDTTNRSPRVIASPYFSSETSRVPDRQLKIPRRIQK